MSGSLKRRLGVASLAFYGVGMIVGAGVYSVVGTAAGVAGHAVWLAFAIGAAVAALTALSYAELATMFPRAGAEYVYLRRAFPRTRALPTVVGAVLTLAGASTAATVLLAFGGYVGGAISLPPMVPALGMIVVLTIINLVGIAVGSRVNIVLTLLEVGGLVAFVALAAARPELGTRMWEVHLGVLEASAILFFAFLGFENLANLVEEAKRPARDLPRALLISVAVTSLLYVGVGLAATSLLEPERLAASDAPLSSAAEPVAPRFSRWLAGIAALATANTAMIALLSTSRLVYSMSRDGAAPAGLAAVAGRRGTPWRATLLVAGLAAALVPLGKVAVVARLASFAALLSFVAVNLCVIALRYRQPARKRPFRIAGSIGRLPVAPLLGLASAVLLLTQFDGFTYLAGGAALAIGLLVHLVARRRRTSRRPSPDNS